MKPFPHVLLSDYYTKDELSACMDECHRLDEHLLPPGQTGSAKDRKTGRPLKFNSGLFLTQAMPNSELIQHSRTHMKDELIEQIDCDWYRYQYRQCNHQSWMLSRYVHGQYYNAHVDTSQFTLLLWMYDEPKPFTGGDLIFPDFDNYTIPCNNNTGIIFYGAMRHEVPPISGNGRYTLTCFTGCRA